MADETGDAQQISGNQTTDDDSTAAKPWEEERKGLLSAAKAEREKRQAIEARLAEIEQEREAAKVEQAKEQGKYRELYEEASGKLSAYEERVQQYEAAEKARVEKLTATNKARLEKLPENLRGLVPEGLAPDAVADQIGRLEAMAQDTPRGTFRGSGGKKTAAKVEAPAEAWEWAAANAARYGLSEEDAVRIIWLPQHGKTKT